MTLQQFGAHGASSDFGPETVWRQIASLPAMFSELTILRAVRKGVIWRRASFDDFDQIATLCRNLCDEGYFSLEEKWNSGAPETLVISDFTEAGTARLNLLRQE